MYLHLWSHIDMDSVNSYEGSFSKWYLLRGANHPGMAMIDQSQELEIHRKSGFYSGEVLPAPASFCSAVYTAL